MIEECSTPHCPEQANSPDSTCKWCRVQTIRAARWDDEDEYEDFDTAVYDGMCIPQRETEEND